jgi:hypothetical protein
MRDAARERAGIMPPDAYEQHGTPCRRNPPPRADIVPKPIRRPPRICSMVTTGEIWPEPPAFASPCKPLGHDRCYFLLRLHFVVDGRYPNHVGFRHDLEL